MADTVVLYTNPMSRGRIVHWLLEEIGAPYELKTLDLQKGEQKAPAYLAINPMGKVPTIVHRGVAITETAAILLYLADAFPAAGLAPRSDDPARGTYLRWLVFGASCFEPALVDRILQRSPPQGFNPLGYGTYAQTLDTFERAVTPGPFVLGERFSAADVLLASQLWWAGMMKALEPRAKLDAYQARCLARPAYQRADAAAAKLMAR
jgi:glutathione S-transferase